MCAPDNKNEVAKNREILKLYLPWHGLHAGKGGLPWPTGVLMTLKSTERDASLVTPIMS